MNTMASCIVHGSVMHRRLRPARHQFLSSAFSLALPYVGLTATVALSVVIGLVLSSAFSAIVVYGQELMPGRVGMVSGLFFGIAFGLGGIGAAVLGEVADWTSIEFVYRVCAFLPAIGLLAAFLPNLDTGFKTAPAR